MIYLLTIKCTALERLCIQGKYINVSSSYVMEIKSISLYESMKHASVHREDSKLHIHKKRMSAICALPTDL